MTHGLIYSTKEEMSQDTSHLCAIHERLSRERERRANATDPQEIALRDVWIAQAEKELAAEESFLGLEPVENDMSDEALLAALFD